MWPRIGQTLRVARPLLSLCLLVLVSSISDAHAQQIKRIEKLPSADKIINKYIKTIGGKKRLVRVRDSVSEWTIQRDDQVAGTARIFTKTPASSRSELTLEHGQIITGANASSAWAKEADGLPRTLTGSESTAARLQAVLAVGQFIDYKKHNVAARVLAENRSGAASVFVIEFSTRGGGRILCHFSRTTGLLVAIVDVARGLSTRLSDYRWLDGLLTPFQMQLRRRDTGDLSLLLTSHNRNTGLTNVLFDPPPATEALDVEALLRTVSKNQDELEKRFAEYSFLQKQTDREISGKGEVKKQKSRVYEVFPIANRRPIMKLISENGIALKGDRASKEGQRVREELEKAERNRQKEETREKSSRNVAQRQNEDDVEISHFLRVCEFVSPRRERFGNREAVVFDFRPREGFRPKNRQESLISKLVGVIWIDPVDRQVMRLEARLAEGFKLAGGLLLSLSPGAAFVMEQTRMAEGVWLPRFAQINLSIKVLLFGGGDLNRTIEWSDYRHFSGDVQDYSLDAPWPSQPSAARP